MSHGNSPNQPGNRTEAYGQDYRLTPADRFGVWLSRLEIQRFVKSPARKRVADIGCGYHASLIRAWLPQVQSALLVDVALAPDLKTHAKVQALEGRLPDVLTEVASGSIDILICNSVLEHLWEPLSTVQEVHRLLAPGGIALWNVPSWRGKYFLELFAFRLGWSPAAEMDDHKMYYDVRDLWPLLVRGGFRPHHIRCFRHKFGLNVFAVCYLDA